MEKNIETNEANKINKFNKNKFETKLIFGSGVKETLKEDTKAKLASFPSVKTEELIAKAIEKVEKKEPPMSVDRAEYWALKLYYNKKTENELEEEIKTILDNIKDPEERTKAKKYLEKVVNKIENTVIHIKEDVAEIEGDLKKLRERTEAEIKGYRSIELNVWQKIWQYIKRGTGYLFKLAIPTVGIKMLEDASQFIKDIEFWKKAIAVITFYTIEEAIVKTIADWRKKATIRKIEEEYDLHEKSLKERSKKIRDNLIEMMKVDIKRIENEIYHSQKKEDKQYQLPLTNPPI